MESNNSTNFTILGYRLNKLIGESDNLLILESWFEEYLEKYQRQILKEYQTYKSKAMAKETTEDEATAEIEEAVKSEPTSNENNQSQYLNEVPQNSQPKMYAERS